MGDAAKEQFEETKQEIKDDIKEAKEGAKEEKKEEAKEKVADELKEAALGGDTNLDLDDPEVDEKALLDAALAKMDGAGKGFLGKIIEIIKDTSNPHNRMQEIYIEPFAVRGRQGSKKSSTNEYIMYFVTLGNSKYLCFDEAKNFKFWMKYAVVAMKAYKREEKRLGKIEPKTG